MNWRSKKVGLSLLASVILLSSLFGYQFALSTVPASGPYYLDVPFGTASYYVGKFDNGSTYMVKGDTWQCTWVSSDSSAVINACIGNLTSGRTWQEKVLLKGNFVTNGTIWLENFLDLEIDGSITALDNMNSDLIANSNQSGANYQIYLHGGVGGCILDGNGVNQGATSRGIYLRNAVSPPNLFDDASVPYPSAYKIENLVIKNTRGTGFYVDFSGSILSQIGVRDVSVWEGKIDQAVYWKQVYDSYWYGGLIGGTAATYGFKFESLAGCDIKLTYANGYHLFIGCNMLMFSCAHMDSSQTALKDTIEVSGCWDSVFSDIKMRFIGDQDNAYDAIKLTEAWEYYNCSNLIFSNIIFLENTYNFKYGIEETDDGQDYNLYCGLHGFECETGVLRRLGVNSKADADSIIGTIVTS